MRKQSSPPRVSLAAPGAAPTSPADLLVGIYATCTVDKITTLHLFDWELRITQSLTEVTAHGDEWEQWIPLRQGWTARARGYMTKAATVTDLYHGGGAFDRSSSGDEITFTGYSDFGSTVLFTGTCFAEQVTLTFPNEMVEQEITIRGSAAPSAGPRA